jgi:GAF domain-containing protein
MDRIEGLFAAMRTAGQHVEWQGRDGIATFAQDVSRALCRHFNCSHASLWLLDGEPGEQRLQCLGAHEVGGDSAQSPVCDQHAFPGYFEALLGEGVFRCVDATTDERLRGLPASTWRAMLDVCGQINGKTVGVIALGQRDEAREWTKREELDLRRAAAKTCLRLHALRQELETA